MMTKVIRELTAMKTTSEITSEQVLCWAKRIEAQRVQKAMLETKKESKDFDTVKGIDQQSNSSNNI